jgi:hypothetical protein
MANEYDIQNLTRTAFGYSVLPFPLLGIKSPLPKLNKIGNAIIGKNHIGTPFFMDVIIDDLPLPNEPLITFTNQKKIIQTAIVGSERRGTVKEFISTSDYKIKIEGVCIDPTIKDYPQKQVEEIIKICEKPKSLSFKNSLAELYGIYNIVITSYSFANMQGHPYSQKYYINAVSNDDFYATMKNL